MTLPAWLTRLLPSDTSRMWEALASVVPGAGYLVGGTAVAVHLRHRISRDLDFYLAHPVDLVAVRQQLEQLGPLHVAAFDPKPGNQTLNATLSATKVQFLEASTLRLNEPLSNLAGLRIAGLGDLLATKLKVLLDRPELRDYFDLLTIEQQAHRMAEEGLALAVRMYQPAAVDAFVSSIVRALASFGDVDDDPGVPMSKDEIARYWTQRVPEIAAHLSRDG